MIRRLIIAGLGICAFGLLAAALTAEWSSLALFGAAAIILEGAYRMELR